MMLCCTLFTCTRAPLMKSYNYSKYTIKAGLAQLVARVLYCRVGDHGFGSQGPTNAQGLTQKLRYPVSPKLPCKQLQLCMASKDDRALSSAGASLCCGEAGEREKESSCLFLLPIVPRALTIFDYCYFYKDTQREPMRRRELTT